MRPAKPDEVDSKFGEEVNSAADSTAGFAKLFETQVTDAPQFTQHAVHAMAFLSTEARFN